MTTASLLRADADRESLFLIGILPATEREGGALRDLLMTSTDSAS
jgi:hypothetical protein